RPGADRQEPPAGRPSPAAADGKAMPAQEIAIAVEVLHPCQHHVGGPEGVTRPADLIDEGELAGPLASTPHLDRVIHRGTDPQRCVAIAPRHQTSRTRYELPDHAL